ncbi:1-acyl-sn-glycerol-3-phosphate acyltransferase [Actinomycetospora sp. C-140]
MSLTSRPDAASAILPELVRPDLRSDPRFESALRDIADQLGEDISVVRARADKYLKEMAATHGRVAVNTFNRFGNFLLRAYEIGIDKDRLEALRVLNRRHALVFLPNHRSYLDPFVTRSTLLANGFPSNHCFAGDNMSFWPMGEWTRRTGNIILRRSIGNDPLYKFVLREYIGQLIRQRQNLEWYIEGGRTRTGKLRPPKYGLLTYLVDGFEGLPSDVDMYLVPMSIVYDGLPEVTALISEQQGSTKKPESFSWLLNFPRSAGQGFGAVHLCLGEPLSLRAALAAADASSQSEEGRQARLRIEKVAFEVSHRINQATPVTQTALVTLALLGVDDRALTLPEIRRVVAPYLDYFARRKIVVTGDLSETSELRRTLDWLTERGIVLAYDGGLEPVWGISPNRHLEAAFYRNSLVHLLVDRAVVELVLASAANGTIVTEADAWDEALRLRDLFKFEFFFPDKQAYRENLESELALIDEGWAQRITDPDRARRMLAQAEPHLAHRVLASFVEIYAVVADRLATTPPDATIDVNAFVLECFGVARQRLMQHRLRTSDSVSTEVVRTALQAAAHRQLLGAGGPELSRRRQEFARELGALRARLAEMAQLAREQEEAQQ